MQEASLIHHVHPSGVVIEIDITSHRYGAWVGTAAVTCGIVGIDEAADREPECVCYTCSHAIMIS